MPWCLALILALLVNDPVPERPLLVEELSLVALESGAELEVLVHYQSLIGPVLMVEDCEIEFRIPQGKEFPILRNHRIREFQLVLRVRAQDSGQHGQPAHFEILEARRGPELDRFFREIWPSLGELSSSRRRVFLEWALKSSRKNENAVLFAEVAEAMLSEVEKACSRAKEQDLQDALTWLKIAQSLLSGEPRWIAAAIDFANRHGDHPVVARSLVGLELIYAGTGWRREADFFNEIDMSRYNGELMTVDRLHTVDTLERWGGGKNETLLLRGLTKQQYQMFARNRIPQEGMKRDEVLIAWGYPQRVTWLRRKNCFFEGWFYTSRRAYLVDGLLFSWEE